MLSPALGLLKLPFVQVYHRLPPNQYRSCRCVLYPFSRGFFQNLLLSLLLPGFLPRSPIPSSPKCPGRRELRAVAGWVQGKHVLTAMLKLSRSEPGGADSAPAGVWTQAAGKAAGAPAAEWARVPRGAVRSARAQSNQMHNFPGRSSRLPGFRGRGGVGVSWNGRGRGRSHPRGFRSPLTITSVPPSAPASFPGSLGDPRAGAAGTRARRPEFPDTRGTGGEGGAWGP